MNDNRKLIVVLLLTLFLLPAYASNENPYAFTLEQHRSRFQTLIKEIRCVVCQNQNIADSNAPLANDLRNKVYEMIIHHQSDEEIKNYLVKRYGEFILLRPRFTKLTAMLWFFPLLGLIMTGMFIYRYIVKYET